LIFTLGYILTFKGVFFPALLENTSANWLFGISPEGIGFVGMLLNFGVAFAVSRVTAPPPAEITQLVEHIRVPR
jgi:cation/acetate symporter